MSNQWSLKPCPFCGSDEEERFDLTENKTWLGMEWSTPVSYVLHHWCKGTQCHIEIRDFDKDNLFAYWNAPYLRY